MENEGNKMNQNLSIKKNIFMNTVLTASNFIFPLITFSYVARTLTPVGTGKVAFAMSIITYFAWLTNLGIPIYGVRLCAKVRDDKNKLSQSVQEIISINIFFTIIAYILFVIAVMTVPKLREEWLLYFVLSIQMILNPLGLEWLYQALEQYTYITLRSLFFKLISVILTFLFIKNPNDYVIYGGLTIFTTSFSYILNFINARKYISFIPIKGKKYRQHLKPLVTLTASSMMITLYSNFDVVMIGFLKNDSMVGMYNASLKVKNIVLSTSTAVTSVLIPRMSIYFQKNETQKFRELSMKSLRTSLILAFPLITYILFNPSDVILFVSGDAYLPAVNTLRILMISTYALILTNLFGMQMLIPMNKENLYSKSVFYGMFINLALNFLLIPAYGASGAAMGTFITEIFNVYWMSKGIKSERSFLIKSTKISIYFCGILVSVISLLIVQYLIVNFGLILRLTVTTVIFFGTYYFWLYCLNEPLIKSILSSNKIKKLFMKI